jgi:hypothetical protein
MSPTVTRWAVAPLARRKGGPAFSLRLHAQQQRHVTGRLAPSRNIPEYWAPQLPTLRFNGVRVARLLTLQTAVQGNRHSGSEQVCSATRWAVVKNYGQYPAAIAVDRDALQA